MEVAVLVKEVVPVQEVLNKKLQLPTRRLGDHLLLVSTKSDTPNITLRLISLDMCVIGCINWRFVAQDRVCESDGGRITTVHYNEELHCPTCKGLGQSHKSYVECPTCEGTGLKAGLSIKSKLETINIKGA